MKRPEQTICIMAYSSGWPTGIAERQSDGSWDCRRLEDPYKLDVKAGTVETERRAVRWLKTSRWARSLKKIRVPIEDTYEEGDEPMTQETKGLDIVCRREGVEPRFNIEHQIKHHSPSGMEWGYLGSGPADFALNILLHFVDEKRAFELHQDFKFKFVATLPEEGGMIPAKDIQAWLAEQRALTEFLGVEEQE